MTSPANLPLTSLGRVIGVFTGGPNTLHDDGGEWVSTIYRDPVHGPVAVETRGLAGDQATQPYNA